MEHITTQDLPTLIPNTIIDDLCRCHVALLTTRRVTGLDPGRQQTGSEDLTIEIASGMDDSSVVALGMASLMVNGDMSGLTERTAEIGKQLPKSFETTDGADLVIVKYLSLTGFSTDVEALLEIRTQYPDTQIIAVTCDCDMDWKSENLRRFSEAPNSWVLVTGGCGGYDAMRAIYDAIMEAWPLRKGATGSI